jgi:hypothetical protein
MELMRIKVRALRDKEIVAVAQMVEVVMGLLLLAAVAEGMVLPE